MSLEIRPYEHATDEALVFDTWLNSYRRSHFRGPFPTDIYLRSQRETIQRLVGPAARWGTRTLMAFDPEDAGTRFDIYGYIVVEDGFDHPVMHYVYTKEGYRKHGVARYLREVAGLGQIFYITHRTPNMQDVKDVFDGALFRPELLWNKKPEPVIGRDGRPQIILPQRDERRGRRRDLERSRRHRTEDRNAANRGE